MIRWYRVFIWYYVVVFWRILNVFWTLSKLVCTVLKRHFPPRCQRFCAWPLEGKLSLSLQLIGTSLIIINSCLSHRKSVGIRPGNSFRAAWSRKFREPLKWWIFRAFFFGDVFWERRNDHLGAAVQPAARLQNFFQVWLVSIIYFLSRCTWRFSRMASTRLGPRIISRYSQNQNNTKFVNICPFVILIAFLSYIVAKHVFF